MYVYIKLPIWYTHSVIGDLDCSPSNSYVKTVVATRLVVFYVHVFYRHVDL